MLKLKGNQKLQNANILELVNELRKRFKTLGADKINIDFNIHSINNLNKKEGELIMEEFLKQLNRDKNKYRYSEKTGTRWLTTEGIDDPELNIFLK